MANPANDPFAMWHRFLGDLEKGSNSFFSKAMESEDFSRVMNQAGGMSAQAQKALGEAMEKYLTGMNLPSRSQLASMGERLQAIENQLGEIKSMLHAMQPEGQGLGRGPDIPRPPRTKQPPPREGSS